MKPIQAQFEALIESAMQSDKRTITDLVGGHKMPKMFMDPPIKIELIVLKCPAQLITNQTNTLKSIECQEVSKALLIRRQKRRRKK